MPILNARPPLVADAPALTFETALSTLIAQKWTVVSEGPSGAQLIGEKKMTRQTRLALIVGAVLLLAIEENDPASLHLVQHVWPDAEVQALLRRPTMIAMRLQASTHRAEAQFWARELATGSLPAIARL